MELFRLNSAHVAAGIKNRDFSAEEYIHQLLDRIEKVERKVNAFITVTGDLALERARQLDRRIKDGGHVGPLAGVALSIKDNICVYKGKRVEFRHTCPGVPGPGPSASGF